MRPMATCAANLRWQSMLNLVKADACVSHAEAALEVNAQTGCVQRAEAYMANEDSNADAALQARLICWFSGWFWSLNLHRHLASPICRQVCCQLALLHDTVAALCCRPAWTPPPGAASPPCCCRPTSGKTESV